MTSFEERSAWVQLVSLVTVLGGYFVVAGIMMSRGVQELIAYTPLFVAGVILLIIVLALGHIVAVFYGKPERHDERDRLIGWRADSNASRVLEGGVLIGITGMVFSIDSVWIAHLLLLSLLLREIVKLSMQLVYYRRGV